MAAVLVALLLFFKPIQAYVLPRSAKSLILASEKSILSNSALYLVSHERFPFDISSLSRWSRSRWALGLDLQDILEDEVDFLQQLRKQMQSPLNASPREVTNRIKTFFASGRRNPEEIEAFKSYLRTNADVMDVVNAILLVEGSDRAGIPLRDLAAWGAVLKAMERPSQLLTSSMVYRGISALRRMGSDNSHCKKFMQLLLARVEDSAVLLHGNDICPSIYSMQSFNANMPEVRQLLSLFSKSLSMTNVPMTSKSICSALFGLKRMKAVPEVRALLLQIAKKIDTADSFYHSVNVCIGLNGLQSMDDSSPEVRAVMRALMAKAIPAHEQGLDQVTDREMSMALFGIQRMGGHQKISRGGQRSNASPELRAVMKYIASLFAFSKVDFEAKRVGLCVLGLSGLSSDTPEVRSLVSEIAVKASRAWGTMSGQEMSMCLHGLSGLRSENAEVVALLESLVHLVKSCPGFKSESEVSSALEGLQGLRSGSAVVDNFVGAVAGLLQRSALNGTLSAPHYLASLYGLQRLSTSSAEVRKLVSKLPFLLNKNGTERIDATDFSSALYGCRALNSQNEETLALVHSLTPLVAGIQGSMSALNVGSALYGLQKLRSDAREVRGLVAALAPAVASAEGVMTHKSISMALNGLQGMSSKQREVRELVNSLAGLMERAETQFTGFADFQEVSGALAGLADMSGDCAEVHRLVSSLARLLAATDMTKFRDVKGERVATALFGLQGQSSRLQPSRDIMLSLVTPLKLMTNFRGKELGMALQGFKDCAGKPPTGYDEVLAVLSTKISGWAGVEVRGRRQSSSDLQITLRSALWGVSKLDRRHASVRAVLLAIAGELLAVINSGEKLDAKTLNAFKEVYRGGDIESEAIVAQLFMALNLEVPTEVTEKKWKKKSPAEEVSKQLDPAEPPVKSTLGKAIAHSSNA